MPRWWPCLSVFGPVVLLLGACSGADPVAGEPEPPEPSAATDGGTAGKTGSADAAPTATPDAGGDASPPEPTSRAPCDAGQCWQASSLSGLCGSSTVSEDFGSGKYNVHQYALALPAGVMVDLKLEASAGAWNPALIVNGADGTTLFDGAQPAVGKDPQITALSSGKGQSVAHVQLTAKAGAVVSVFVTDWYIVDGGFTPSMPSDASYSLTTKVDCEPPGPGTLLSPPNFDGDDVVNGYFLLPDSVPSGLYTHKADGCSRGTKLLIDSIYTVATHWKPLYPSLSPLSVMDMNEGPCSTVDHATHDDGTHVDIVAGCATDISCANKAPKLALAKLFVDTGVACGILNNDVAVQSEVNAYFAQKTTYAPWKGTFMRSVTGHVKHFHVRVKRPNGSCD